MPVEEVRKLIDAIDHKKTKFNYPPFIGKKLRELVRILEPKDKHKQTNDELLQQIENKIEQKNNELQQQIENKFRQTKEQTDNKIEQTKNELQQQIEQTKDEIIKTNNELKEQMIKDIQELLNGFIKNSMANIEIANNDIKNEINDKNNE